jgi:hypothetical protein
MIRFLAVGWMDGKGWECERGLKMKGGRTQAAADGGSPGKQGGRRSRESVGSNTYGLREGGESQFVS